MKNALNDIKSFSNFSGMCPNLDKWKIAEIGVLKNVNVAIWGMKNMNLTKESIKFFGNTCFSQQENSRWLKIL